jgi:glycerol dehydrogenase-like iron-containing ADH family enzyme
MEIRKIAVKSCREGESIYNEAGPVDPDTISAAIKAANAYGRTRKSAGIS